VFGAPSSAARAIKAAGLLERGFTANPLSWLTPSLGTVETLQPINADPPNLRDEMCGNTRKRPATEDEDDSAALANISSDSAYAVFLSSLRLPSNNKRGTLLQDFPIGDPVPVFVGPPNRQPAGTRVASIDPKTGKPIKVAVPPPAPAQPALRPAIAAAVPWTNLSPTGLADHPPPELTGIPLAAPLAIPLPHPRPKVLQAPPQRTAVVARPVPPAQKKK
jgi:D-alanyl-D-alanine carboxypeptidase